MDSFFKQRFPIGKCKTLLKLTIPRIKLLRNRREIQIKQMRREIAKLLETGQEATARIRVEHIIREEKMMSAQEIVELFCELIAVRLPIIESQRECPLDLKEAISSVCFAAPRCADLTELVQVQILFAGKYGKEFVSAATELMPECGVNRQLVELLSIRAPAADVKVKLLKEIAEEHELDWDPTATENELLKPHEDLLNGPTHFTSGYKLPLPGEKHDESLQSSKSGPVTDDSDEDFDIVDYPEIPKHPVKSNKGNVSVPEMLPFPVSALSEDDNEEEPNPVGEQKNRSHLGSDNVVSGKPVIEEDASSKYIDAQVEVKQFVPFMSPPSQSSLPLPVREYDSVPRAAKTRNDHVDLQDVLAAAQAAAESAERAAAAARSAASIAQLRIAELVKRKNDEVPTPTEGNPFHLGIPMPSVPEMKELNKKISGDGDSASTSPSQNAVSEYYAAHQPAVSPSYYYDIQAADPSSTVNNVLSPSIGHHQPHRLPWMEDETHFSYPNLFSSEGSNLSTRTQSFTDNK